MVSNPIDGKFSNATFTSSADASAQIRIVVALPWVSLKYPIIGLMPLTATWCDFSIAKNNHVAVLKSIEAYTEWLKIGKFQ